ncbi:MAG: hypothetical protein IME94_09520, partial [Proteobacteria bacterium]|nr:hypothetical protein [Pseudomonadota bacterium]
MYKNADGVMEFSGTKQRSKAVVKEDKLHKTSDSVKRAGVQRMAEVNAYNAEHTKKYEAKMQARYESAQLDKQDKMRERE